MDLPQAAGCMKHTLIALAACALPLPAIAQELTP
jgi:hypothetical protein